MSYFRSGVGGNCCQIAQKMSARRSDVNAPLLAVVQVLLGSPRGLLLLDRAPLLVVVQVLHDVSQDPSMLSPCSPAAIAWAIATTLETLWRRSPAE